MLVKNLAPPYSCNKRFVFVPQILEFRGRNDGQWLKAKSNVNEESAIDIVAEYSSLYRYRYNLRHRSLPPPLPPPKKYITASGMDSLGLNPRKGLLSRQR